MFKTDNKVFWICEFHVWHLDKAHSRDILKLNKLCHTDLDLLKQVVNDLTVSRGHVAVDEVFCLVEPTKQFIHLLRELNSCHATVLKSDKSNEKIITSKSVSESRTQSQKKTKETL